MADNKNLDIRAVISRPLLQRLAGARSFERGVDYFERGLVRSLVEHEGIITAKVMGQEVYQVQLWVVGDSLSASCTCPMYAEGNFCKHCVATSLAVIAVQEDDDAGPCVDVVKMDDVRGYLLGLDKDVLVRMILDQAVLDDCLRTRLLLKAARKRGKEIDMARFRQAIDDAVYVDRFVDYRSMADYAAGIESAVEAIGELLEEGHAAQVIELCEYALEAVEDQLGTVDDSDGYLGGILDDVQELHHEACVVARPDPEDLARRLFQWGMEDEWGLFGGAAQMYADVLGDRGLAMYRQLAEAEWAKVPPLKPGDDSSERSGARCQITSIMEILARQSGDLEARVEVMSRDLSLPHSFFRIAETYQAAGRKDKAIVWAERGLVHFPDHGGGRLREFLAEAYHGEGRHDDAMALAWDEFARAPGLFGLQKLRSHAERAGGWTEWREKGLECLRESIEGRRQEAQDSRWLWMRTDSSELVRVFLWEGDVEAAWREAQQGGCSGDLWLELAGLRQNDHPLDSLKVYEAQVDPIIDRKTNSDYEQAVELIQRVGSILTRLGRGQEFPAYVEGIKRAHRRKRNLMALLDGIS